MSKRILSCLLVVIIISSNFKTVKAEPEPVLVAEAAILIDQPTGKILYSKNEHERMFPASMTKILTALVALDYLEKDEIVIAGREIHNVTIDSSLAGHRVGESLLVENIIRGLIIPSGNETSNVVAMEVARRFTNNENITYENAEKVFADLMNSKAKSLGAKNSNFVNPHGLHDPNHFTSAYDMALIATEAMKNDLIREIAGAISFVGNGAGENPPEDAITKEYDWYTHNSLLLSSSPYSYPYATGIKTGFTNEAGHCVAASAEKDGKSLIAIVFFSPEPSRWIDAATLFDYGFDNFDYEVIQESDVILDEVELENQRLDENNILEVITNEDFGDIFSEEQVKNIKREITYNEYLIATNESENDTTLRLKAPITEGTAVARVAYSLDNEIIFEGDLLATRDVSERTLKSDMEYYFDQFKDAAFSLMAIPFWIAGIALIFIIAKIVSFLNKRKHNNYRRLRRRY